ncbi:MAG: SPASM domain-containing protein, partial [Syntrophales bacterium LBB04]|nr:SPASM domain-containing protein [Syntrophales bacterium LBB04]
DMRLEEYKKILPFLEDVEYVVLEGGGESLLHKNLAECISLAKEQGPDVGFVTSAKGLTGSRIAELIDAGLDFVGFSIAGTTEGTHDAIRVNSHLSEVLDAIRSFNEEKMRRGLTRPRMHLAFLMLKENIFEAPEVPSLAKELGIGEVVFTNICHWINTWQEEQRVFEWRGSKNQNEAILKQAEAKARALGVHLRRPSLSAIDVSVCEENPLRTLYISAEGELSPCVYLHPPLAAHFKRIFCSREYWTERLSFGNIFRESFDAIWEKESYVRFRESFLLRRKAFEERYGWLTGKGEIRMPDNNPFPDPPEMCRTCHKMLGV